MLADRQTHTQTHTLLAAYPDDGVHLRWGHLLSPLDGTQHLLLMLQDNGMHHRYKETTTKSLNNHYNVAIQPPQCY